MQLTPCYVADADEFLCSSLPAESLLKLEPNFRGRASANDIQQCDYYGRLDFATSVWKSRTMDTPKLVPQLPPPMRIASEPTDPGPPQGALRTGAVIHTLFLRGTFYPLVRNEDPSLDGAPSPDRAKPTRQPGPVIPS